MASLQEILNKAGTIENAERLAKFLSDDKPEYLLDLQLVLSAQGKFDDAWEVSNRATKLYPDDHRVAFNRGWLVMQRGDLLKGFELMDRGRFCKIWGNSPLQSTRPMWTGVEELSGKTVLFYCEAGFGDEIVFVRFAKILADRGAKVVIATSSCFMSLFSRMEGVYTLVDKQVALAVYHDYWVPSMSAAKLCGVEYNTLSGKKYLFPEPGYESKWIDSMQTDALKIGIRWSGNPQFEYDQNRSIPPENLLSLATIDGVKLYSLQRDNDLIYLPDEVENLGPKLESWEDTAAAISCLDMVITSCTSVAHLAAALGKKTWVVVPIMPYYVWVLPGEESPWYNSVRLFRQEAFGDWNAPLQKVTKELELLVEYQA